MHPYRHFLLITLAIVYCSSVYGQDDPSVQKVEIEENVVEEDLPTDCSREALLSFFPKPIVFKVLKQYGVPKEKWNTIYRQLEERDRNVIRLVEEKAAAMDPNPLKDLRHRSEAVRLFRETLIESFSTVMKMNGIDDQREIEEMLDDIQVEKARAFAECMENMRQ